jgi:hypothetical protein
LFADVLLIKPSLLNPCNSYKAFYLYTATISQAYLHCLDMCYKILEDDVDISRTTVPFCGSDRFLDSLGSALAMHSRSKRRLKMETSTPVTDFPYSA